VLKRGDALLTMKIARPFCDAARVALYNRHKQLRGLDSGDGLVDEDGYAEFLVESCVDTYELSYWHEERLVAVAVSDRAANSLNAVYCYYEPTFDEVSLGTYNVLKQIELCRTNQLDYLYLGFYIAASPHMNYKANFRPHERPVDGKWTRFDRDGT
jgi:arginine-tRNA-protein transferase